MAAKHALSFLGDTTELAIPATGEEILMQMTAMAADHPSLMASTPS